MKTLLVMGLCIVLNLQAESVTRSTTPETVKEHSKINLKKAGKKAYPTSKESSNQNHKNVIMSLDKHLYLGISTRSTTPVVECL